MAVFKPTEAFRAEVLSNFLLGRSMVVFQQENTRGVHPWALHFSALDWGTLALLHPDGRAESWLPQVWCRAAVWNSALPGERWNAGRETQEPSRCGVCANKRWWFFKHLALLTGHTRNLKGGKVKNPPQGSWVSHIWKIKPINLVSENKPLLLICYQYRSLLIWARSCSNEARWFLHDIGSPGSLLEPSRASKRWFMCWWNKFSVMFTLCTHLKILLSHQKGNCSPCLAWTWPFPITWELFGKEGNSLCEYSMCSVLHTAHTTCSLRLGFWVMIKS